ncbi:MAG: PEP/pyruvate-binding domain-containing protein [Desulfobacterales bacterium]|jgi:pyruvate,orthophosphate dikinase
MVQSKALEINIADYHVEVSIDPKYRVLQEVLSNYHGLQEGLSTFLKELSHPYKNWQFIVNEARGYTLDYFHLIKAHPDAEKAVGLYLDIYLRAIESTSVPEVRSDAVDNLLLFLLKIAKETGDDLGRFIAVLDGCFAIIRKYPQPTFEVFLKSYYQLNRLGQHFLECLGERVGAFEHFPLLLIRYYKDTYHYWLSEEDPHQWFEREVDDKSDREISASILGEISHSEFNRWQDRLDDICQTADLRAPEVLEKLLELPSFHYIVDVHRRIPSQLQSAGDRVGKGHLFKLVFLFYQMNISGLSLFHEEALREINRTLKWIIDHEKPWNIRKLIDKTFSILKARADHYPTTALNCILNVGKGVYRTDDIDLINFFIDQIIDLGFQAPMIKGVGNDWQIQVNPAHLQNVRTWLELIEINPKRSTRLISYLIIHLSLCGVFIKDTDLFPRDITQFLNSGIGPVYNIAKQLARQFPVYFNDIGAEGKLRDISTQLDEITHRKDVLIHFLRKQCHVESSNHIVSFMEAILDYWRTQTPDPLKPFVPPNIYRQVIASGGVTDGIQSVMTFLEASGMTLPGELLRVSEAGLDDLLASVDAATPTDRTRVSLAAMVYRLLNQKYNLDFIEIGSYTSRLKAEGFPGLDALEVALSEENPKKKLSHLLDVDESLKAIILDPAVFEIREDIYKKRHFTIDIPSMYGSYHERKFDALGLTFRIESLINVLFEKLIHEFDLSLITRATFHQIHSLLLLFEKALKLEGISSISFERQMELLSHALETRGFTFTQYLDVFRGFARAVKNIINDYINNVHEQNLSRIINQTPAEQVQAKYFSRSPDEEGERLQHRIPEIFFRDLISSSMGLQQLDLFLSRILSTLFHQSSQLPKNSLHRLLNYDPQRATTSLVRPNRKVEGIIFFGNKGWNLMRLRGLGMPVPPGFIITTEAFRCWEIIETYRYASDNFRDQVARNLSILEAHTGRKFGDPSNPLMLSVRSGSSISQPGMMDTFLDVGMNEAIAEGLAQTTENEWFAWDNYRRFLQCYGMAFGLQRDDFDAIIGDHKSQLGVPYKKEFTGDQMKALALAYKALVRESGIDVPDDVFEQLLVTISRVFMSWESDKAKAYRKIMGISDDWGTAVTVQQMVFGNMSEASGSGVIFTHNPRWSGDTLRLWGDFTIGNQGEDVVAGLVKTLPISVNQQDIEMRDTDITLETHFPEIYDALKAFAGELIENLGWGPQELEFTFESGSADDLYLLQTRDMAIRERRQFLQFFSTELATHSPLGHGIGVSGGAMSGRLVFSLDDISYWRDEEPDTSLILARGDTVPDDIREIHAADGLLTARGGLTSHAAVVVHRLGRTAVVGCGEMICNEKKKTLQFGSAVLAAGDFISIDGQQGSVYRGKMSINTL